MLLSFFLSFFFIIIFSLTFMLSLTTLILSTTYYIMSVSKPAFSDVPVFRDPQPFPVSSFVCRVL